MPTELKDDLDEQEELNISDDGGDDDGSDLDHGADGEPEDRGDDFVDPELECNDDSAEDAKPTDDEGTGGEGDKADTAGDGEGSIPASRLGEVARTKSAATAIADGLVDGSIDPSVVRDFGGAAAVAKAIANREMSLDDLKTGIVPFKQDEQQKSAANPNDPSTWDLRKKYVEYQELVDAGETAEAAELLDQLHDEKIARSNKAALEKQQEQIRKEQEKAVVAHVDKILKAHPELRDVTTELFDDVVIHADNYQAKLGIDRIAALDKALIKVGLVSSGNDNLNGSPNETPQQRTLRLRKEAAIKKAASAQNQQPPPMGLGATPQGAAKVDIDKLGEDDFAKLSKEEKAALRGDKL